MRGLVIGKFYPPHRGHKHLIDAAEAVCDAVSVIVCQRPGEDPPGDLRAAWIREIHPHASVLLVDDVYDPDDSRVWAENAARWLGSVPDAVFTSERYGDAFASHLGCRHVLVDRERSTVPVSGTAVRADPLGCWDYLEPAVRAHYARRVCLVGAESTGKTTLAADLARHFETVWVPEYGRELAERMLAERGRYEFRTEDFVEIARRQCELEAEAARRANRVLVCDTDAFATSIWHRRYMGHGSPDVESIARAWRRPDLYLLTDVDTPFVQDGTRDGEQIRAWMHEAFVESLAADGRPYVMLSGPFDERFHVARKAVARLLERA